MVALEAELLVVMNDLNISIVFVVYNYNLSLAYIQIQIQIMRVIKIIHTRSRRFKYIIKRTKVQWRSTFVPLSSRLVVYRSRHSLTRGGWPRRAGPASSGSAEAQSASYTCHSWECFSSYLASLFLFLSPWLPSRGSPSSSSPFSCGENYPSCSPPSSISSYC